MEKGRKKSKSAGTGKSSKEANNAKAKKSFFGFKKDSNVTMVRYREGIDHVFLILVITLLAIGTVMVFSASYANALNKFGDSYHYAKKQLMMVAIGLVGMGAIASFIDYRWLQKFSGIIFIGVLIFNYITPFYGKLTNGATRWFVLFGQQVQPSEFLKIALIMIMAHYIVTVGDNMKTFKWGLFFPGCILIAIGGAMLLQSHFSGLIIMLFIGLALIFIGGAPIKWLGLFGGAVGSVLAYMMIFTSYSSERIQTWLDPFKNPSDEGWQIINSLYAIGSGGLWGVGFGMSRQKYLYLPEPQNDFIFAIICEEMGFIGAIIIILLFVLLIWRGFVIAFHAPDKYSMYVVMGIMIKVAIQTLLNIAVVTNSIPTTGISLPFFSYGGTALIILMAEMGIVLCISRYSYYEKG